MNDTEVAKSADDLRPGDRVEVEIGPVAHGGHCVARYQGRVVFVRLGLPGETAVVEITEARRGSFCRGEVVEVLRADPRRVEAPCSHFRPGGCGGCDFQHASGDLQRELKASVVREQLSRLAGLDRPVSVEELPGGGFGWRTRVRWALDPEGRIGPRAVRSHRVEGVNPTEPCLIAAPGLNELAATVEVPSGVHRPASAGSQHRSGRQVRGRAARPELPEVVLTAAGDGRRLAIWPDQPGTHQVPTVTEHAIGRDFSVAADGFWQVHPAAADTLSGAVAQALTDLELIGASSWDLYGGVGLFSEVLAEAVGESGTVVSVEGDRTASALAVQNMAIHPQVSVVLGSVEKVIDDLPDTVDVVVLDPPRAGAGPALCEQIAARAPAVIVYVACDPAALGRDTAALMAAGYRLDTLRAFDCFPQTHHVECVARFLPA
ncbi:tRNA/tmRNA/rRNA uracil-C5-methylase, TrmA/RlmC/RlmD family [Nakamurella panacisegetis]|uniref:tRNA/tmRNA/rRNA uracil-C5-methylase, TrmA/RlmC/RlmD family n=1 Tax=Nakamurella panacisegetis TaxID=1090615 RepID=A0A1H0QGM6_9ACTN|nr:TRAM domain-containing protein [Nakamurella panacisegetis]SDP16541.1 tRNA/tmRNA/rRNA uracil-C5-methylase, TrmA/RlmC/RlmD family [Nakamurella panacisegetis]